MDPNVLATSRPDGQEEQPVPHPLAPSEFSVSAALLLFPPALAVTILHLVFGASWVTTVLLVPVWNPPLVRTFVGIVRPNFVFSRF